MCTDGIKFQGQSFTALPPDRPFKYLGVRVTMTGDARFEKEYVTREMERRLSAIHSARFLPPVLEETVIKVGAVSVFRYSAGLVPWTLSELEHLTGMWTGALRRAWRMPPGSDSALFRLPVRAGGRGCPSALRLWITDVL